MCSACACALLAVDGVDVKEWKQMSSTLVAAGRQAGQADRVAADRVASAAGLGNNSS